MPAGRAPHGPILHLALATEWHDALAAGEYRRSTLDASLDDVGFVHCCFPEQLDGVLRRHYAGVTEPLVRLEIDPTRLDAEVVVEDLSGAGEASPHVYGPIPVAAVTAVTPHHPMK
jgi:uncharacterized protein (DUF952 family)